MSRPQKKHKPLKGGFNEILAAVAMGSGRGKRVAHELQRKPPKQSQPESNINPGDADKKL
jgi:hypothetical protein